MEEEGVLIAIDDIELPYSKANNATISTMLLQIYFESRFCNEMKKSFVMK